MARRRSEPSPAGNALSPPAELLECLVEVWAAAWVPTAYELEKVRSRADLDFLVKGRAFSAHRRARHEWLTAHGVPWKERVRVIPLSKPRFRDYAAFWAERGGGYGA